MDDISFWRIACAPRQTAHDIRAGGSLRRVELDGDRLPSWIQARERFDLIRCIDADYPAALWDLPYPPKQLWLCGNSGMLNQLMSAIVGSRQASIHGREMARIAAEAAGDVVISGGARGIDQVAHHAALPATIAVMAGGLNHLFPPQCRKLLEQIAADGLIISEQFPDTPPRAGLFPVRNRVIAALCRRLLVIEGTLKSGSLITAQCALELGREVWAVPGSPLNPLCQGPNRLIRDGALVFLESEDWGSLSLAAPCGCADHPIRQALSANPHTPGELAAHLQRPLPEVLNELLALKQSGHVRVSGGRYAWQF